MDFRVLLWFNSEWHLMPLANVEITCLRRSHSFKVVNVYANWIKVRIYTKWGSINPNFRCLFVQLSCGCCLSSLVEFVAYFSCGLLGKPIAHAGFNLHLWHVLICKHCLLALRFSHLHVASFRSFLLGRCL